MPVVPSMHQLSRNRGPLLGVHLGFIQSHLPLFGEKLSHLEAPATLLEGFGPVWGGGGGGAKANNGIDKATRTNQFRPIWFAKAQYQKSTDLGSYSAGSRIFDLDG